MPNRNLKGSREVDALMEWSRLDGNDIDYGANHEYDLTPSDQATELDIPPIEPKNDPIRKATTRLDPYAGKGGPS